MKIEKQKLRTHFLCHKITEDQARAARTRRMLGRMKSNKFSDFRSGRSFNSHNTELLWSKLPDTL